LVATSVIFCLLVIETFLRVYAAVHTVLPPPPAAAVPAPISKVSEEIVVPPEVIAAAKSRRDIMSLPEVWEHRSTQVSGAVRAETWHGVLEVYNQDGMRWATGFPPKHDDVYRVMIVGDSFTYGEGLAEEWRFSNLLSLWMDRDFRIEFLNLGVQGLQSEDILHVIIKYLPILKPNLVVYAVCLNDFLPSGRTPGYFDNRRYNEALPASYNEPYPFPLPDSWKNFLQRHTRTGAFLTEIYDGALRRLHLRMDMYDAILMDFEGYQKRFARDVADMNRSVRMAGLPPLVAMVVDQVPIYGGRGYQVAKTAEMLLAKAGAEVVGTENFYQRYNGQIMIISRWEWHPNEVANYIWARMIARHLRKREDLVAFRR
jgi:lysophospholipase L1-like esterase